MKNFRGGGDRYAQKAYFFLAVLLTGSFFQSAHAFGLHTSRLAASLWSLAPGTQVQFCFLNEIDAHSSAKISRFEIAQIATRALKVWFSQAPLEARQWTVIDPSPELICPSIAKIGVQSIPFRYVPHVSDDAISVFTEGSFLIHLFEGLFIGPLLGSTPATEIRNDQFKYAEATFMHEMSHLFEACDQYLESLKINDPFFNENCDPQLRSDRPQLSLTNNYVTRERENLTVPTADDRLFLEIAQCLDLGKNETWFKEGRLPFPILSTEARDYLRRFAEKTNRDENTDPFGNPTLKPVRVIAGCL